MSRFLNSLKPLPVQLMICLLAALLFGQYFDETVIRGFYTASCMIKDVLISVLPIIIFAYIFDALLGLDRKAPLLLVTILVMVFLSNMLAVTVSGGVASLLLPLLTPFKGSIALVKDAAVVPYFELKLPTLISPDIAMFTGISLGLLASFFKIEAAKPLAVTLHKLVTWFLHKTFIPLLPLYVIGFVLKLQYEGALVTLIQNYFQVFIIAISLIVAYIAFLYFIGSGCRFNRFGSSVKNMLPAGITGFSIMSSAATMPVTLEASEKNLKDPRFADLIIPTTVNIHLLGDALAIPLTGLALLWFKTGMMPDVPTYAFFTLMFAIAKFSCAGVPGGGVLVVLPVLQKYLGLDQELITLMTTLYILQDSIFTASNVMGNGAFAMIVERICRFFFGNGDDNDDEEEASEKIALFQNHHPMEPCVRRIGK